MLRNLLGAARRFVLVIGNGGALLADVAGGRIGKSWAISDFEDHSLAVIAQALERNRRVPLVVLIDMLEQSYRREAIPPVNVFDRPKVLTRRLGIAFPSFDIRAALPLGEVVGQRGDLAYLFVALPSSPELETWIAFLHGIDNPVTSLGLMPIESVGLAAALARAVTGEDDPPVDWTLLISRERTGGIRQIVVRGDKLSITRLTPAPVAASTPADIALAISQEMTSTLGYLTRLGFAANDRLDVIIIGSEAMRGAIEGRPVPGRVTTVLTAAEAASLLGLAEIDDDEDGYGDLLHVAWAAKKRRPSLQMAGQVLGRRQVQMVAARKWVVAGMATSAIVLGFYCIDQALDVLSARQVVEMGQSGQARLTLQFDALQSKIDEYPDQPRRIIAALEHYDRLTLQSGAPVPVLAAISDSLGPSIRLKSLLWVSEDVRVEKKKSQSASQAKEIRAPGFDVDMAVDLALFRDPDRAIAETIALAERLVAHFTEQTVEIVRPPLDILPTQTLFGADSEDQPAAADETGLSADISINGRPE